MNEVNFNQLSADCGVKLELKTEATQKLFKKLTQLYEVQNEGVTRTDREFVVAEKDKVLVVDDANKQKVIKQILDKGYSEDLWESLLQTNPDLATRLSLARIHLEKQDAINRLEDALINHAGNEGYWQKFFEDHPWILEAAFSASVFMLRGEAYLGGKSSKGRQGIGGVATDFLFGDESTKSLMVIEIKKPDSKLVGSIYRGQADSGLDNEVYSMDAELSGGVAQAQNQLTVAVEHFQSVLGPDFRYKINRIHPKAVLIIGILSKLKQREKDSFNQFRSGFHSPIIITFDELLHRLKKLYGLSSQGIDVEIENGGKSDLDSSIAGETVEPEDIPF